MQGYLKSPFAAEGACVHVLVFSCDWKNGYYVAVQGTREQMTMEVHLKEAADLVEAITDNTNTWQQQNYRIPWTAVICQIHPAYHFWEMLSLIKPSRLFASDVTTLTECHISTCSINSV